MVYLGSARPGACRIDADRGAEAEARATPLKRIYRLSTPPQRRSTGHTRWGGSRTTTHVRHAMTEAHFQRALPERAVHRLCGRLSAQACINSLPPGPPLRAVEISRRGAPRLKLAGAPATGACHLATAIEKTRAATAYSGSPAVRFACINRCAMPCCNPIQLLS